MQKHLEREFNKVFVLFENLCGLVQSNFDSLHKAMENMDKEMFNKIFQDDKLVDDLEITIEEECLKLLALYQPVAGDLRMIVAILKINNDMERISDLTANIAERCLNLADTNDSALGLLIPEIIKNVKLMLADSIQSVKNRDIELAVAVCQLDDKVDAMHSQMYGLLKSAFKKDPDKYEVYMNYISISRFLERIADHTTNIAEDLLYMLEGEIFRHRPPKVRNLK